MIPVECQELRKQLKSIYREQAFIHIACDSETSAIELEYNEVTKVYPIESKDPHVFNENDYKTDIAPPVLDTEYSERVIMDIEHFMRQFFISDFHMSPDGSQIVKSINSDEDIKELTES